MKSSDRKLGLWLKSYFFGDAPRGTYGTYLVHLRTQPCFLPVLPTYQIWCQSDNQNVNTHTHTNTHTQKIFPAARSVEKYDFHTSGTFCRSEKQNTANIDRVWTTDWTETRAVSQKKIRPNTMQEDLKIFFIKIQKNDGIFLNSYLQWRMFRMNFFIWKSQPIFRQFSIIILDKFQEPSQFFDSLKSIQNNKNLTFSWFLLPAVFQSLLNFKVEVQCQTWQKFKLLPRH